ncbi:hypothetical protein JKF63_07523 [Porcisia hertigi]|uniref:Uncharacterized protein n=1 Tax=Porcisia hertigi TaxID=2761500 RepID=A0A836IZL5_9TRYP|nr:hypothetical protein JKF63_07523 [Porcisia hertigi]
MAFTQTDARNAGDVLPLGGGFAFSSQPFGIPLSLHLAPSAPHDSYHQHHHHHEQQRQRQQSHLYVPPEWQGGALVEWSSGTVSYTSDTLGLYEEQQMRARRFYYLPPPPPTALLVAGVPVQGVANSHASVSSAAATEDRSNLRGAVLAQLQRFSRVRRAESALSHGAGASENKEAATPCVFDKRTTATATSVAVVGASRVAPRPAMSCSSSPTSPATMSVVSSPAHPCCCYRCLPLLVQFAQVPSVASPVLRRYLEVLHQRALPGFLVQQLRHGASMASTAVEVASAPSQEEVMKPASKQAPASITEVMKPASKQAPASITGTASARGGCHRRERSRTNRVRQRRGEEDDVTTTNGAKRSKKGSGYKNVTSPAAPCSPKTTGGGVQQWRSTDEALGVFPALQRWLTQRQEGGTATHGTPPSGQPARAGLVDAALPTDDVTQACSGASSEQLAQAETTSPRRHGRNCAPGASGARFSSSPHAETSGTDVGSLDWVDDAVLDEVVVVGVVPRGHPHELKLVVPSRAFCLALTQRLEEVAEAAVQILGFITPLHVALPSDVLVGVHGSPETVSAMHSTFSHDTTNTTTTTTHWRAWLEEEYFTSMWTTLRLRLTAVEWQSVLHDACRSPFLGRWAKCAAEGFGCGGTMLPGETLRTGVGRSAPRTHEWNAEGSPLETTQHVEEAIHNAVRDVQASVRSAAELHTSACLSAAEDLVTRVVLTALVPILHRRITVMYELLRHYASKSLYASHREQCDAYQHWYSMTPSPAAVLRLLQRSGRFGRALARCYPQYDLSPDRSFHPTTALDSGVRGETATPRHAAASRSFPSSPLSRAADKAGVSTDADSGTPKELQVSAPSLSKDEPSCYLNGFSATRAGDSQVRPRSCAGALAEVEDDESPPLSSSPTATTAPMAAASAWVSSPLSSCDEESLQGSSPQEQQPMILTYVPEAALLEPRYLQRFAWWMHRTHHSAGANSFGSAGSIINNNTSSAGVGAQQLSRVSNTVLSIPGDYLRVLPLQEQDPSIRTVLRSMAQKGRTLGLWEMRQHIRHRTSYVYH